MRCVGIEKFGARAGRKLWRPIAAQILSHRVRCEAQLAGNGFDLLAVPAASKTNGLPGFHGNHPLGFLSGGRCLITTAFERGTPLYALRGSILGRRYGFKSRPPFPRLTDLSAREIYATLLDEGTHVGSISTWYRVLRAAGETREHRRQATHPARVRPELVATAPGEVWSWNITKLLGPQKWTYFYLYVVLDVFSRYVVAWRLETRESATLAEELFSAAVAREGVDPTRLTVHTDGCPSMTSKTLTQFFADLGITKSRSRPHVSNDNPYREAQFKTLKYAPAFPGHFANIQQARD